MTKYPRLPPPPRTDLTGSTSSQQFEGSADELNRSILDSTKPYPALRQPDSGMKHYVIGFEGDARGDRRPDQALLRAAGARERYYFTGFRASAVYLPPGALAVLRRDSPVTWVDSAGGVGLKALNSSGQVVAVTGTSYAAPLVAAALALLYDQKLVEMGCKPHPDEALQVLLNDVQPPSGYHDPDWYGAGVVDVFAAVTSGWLFDADICPMM